MDIHEWPRCIKSARRKKRLVKLDLDKQLISLSKMREHLWQQQRDLPMVPLAYPYQRGWKRLFVLRDDIRRGPKADFYEALLQKINTVHYHHDRAFKFKKRRKAKYDYKAKEQKLREIDAYDWDNNRLKLSEEERACFTRVEYLLENKSGEINGTLLSATLIAEGDQLDAFVKEWAGTIQWIAQSPYRKYHKRKNWFVGVATFNIQELMQWNPKDVKLETCRSSGPGGQNVNKVETAVRGIHLPSGLQVVAMDTRSQLENKKLCLARLEAKVLVWQTEQLMQQQQSQWQEHNALERGNPVKTIKSELC